MPDESRERGATPAPGEATTDRVQSIFASIAGSYDASFQRAFGYLQKPFSLVTNLTNTHRYRRITLKAVEDCPKVKGYNITLA